MDVEVKDCHLAVSDAMRILEYTAIGKVCDEEFGLTEIAKFFGSASVC